MTLSKARGNLKHDSNPSYDPVAVLKEVRIAHPSEKREARKAIKFVNQELTDYLSLEFLFEERNATTAKRMHRMALNFIRSRNTDNTTYRELIDAVSSAISTAMVPHVRLSELRNSWKRDEVLKEMKKTNDLVAEGKLGKRGLFNLSLPKKS